MALHLRRSIYIYLGMTPNPENKFCTVPQLDKIPFLFHGFGTSNFFEHDILDKPEWKKFALVSLKQIHSDIVHFIDVPPLEQLSGDALITDLPYVFLSIRTADCLPVFIVSPNPKAVAVLHSGWRGTHKDLVQKVVETMVLKLGIKPDALLAALGPSVEQKCYEVGAEVKDGFLHMEDLSRFFEPRLNRKKKYFFDLKGMNRFQLLGAGIEDKNIYSVDQCTRCDKKYFSFRRDTDETGRMINFIGMSF